MVPELLQWGAPLQLITVLLLLGFHQKTLQDEDRTGTRGGQFQMPLSIIRNPPGSKQSQTPTPQTPSPTNPEISIYIEKKHNT